MSRPVVRVVGLHKDFVQSGPWPWSPRREIPAVQGVDFEVAEGEIIALVGQSGSGKTTVSRLVLGLEEPTSGEVWLDGLRWDELTEAERRSHRVRFQYIPQDAMGALDPQQTALEHIIETVQVLGAVPRGEAIEKATELLTRLGLGARLNALPREMSGGEQRRVTLARVLALKPRLIVADEPTSGLDPARRESVLEALVGNLPPKSACILVTHDMSEARECSHRVLAMLAGRVIEEIDLRDSQPGHPYAQIIFNPWTRAVPNGPLSDTGCAFQHDCPLIDGAHSASCRSEVPMLTAVQGSSTHRVACHAIGEMEDHLASS